MEYDDLLIYNSLKDMIDEINLILSQKVDKIDDKGIFNIKVENEVLLIL